jgi:ParB family transcriptional regulator, chromosome partitioning protein
MTPTMLPIASITDSHNARGIAAPSRDDEMLQASILALGLLQPLLVTPNGTPGRFKLIAGHRRLAAVIALDWQEVPALVVGEPGDAATPDVAMSAAENMVRLPMHPIDTWRAIGALIDQGFSRDGAATALGLTPRYAQRFDKLSRMAPEIIDTLASERELPPDQYLRTIALAPVAVQQKAAADALKRRGKREALDWWAVARACEAHRIPRSRAIFDVESAGVAFDEDLFAEPDSDEQWTTTDIAGFLAAQRGALVEQAAASKGRILLGTFNDKGELEAPSGWQLVWDLTPRRWKKADPRKLVKAVIQRGYDIGKLIERVGVPKPARAATATKGAAAADDAPRAHREPITKAVQGRLAALKGEALRARLPALAESGDVDDALRALLMVFAARNVNVQTSVQLYGRHSIGHLIGKLVDQDGQLQELSARELCALAADIIGHAVMFDHPNAFVSSGPAADWIGRFLCAASEMPRCDSEEILRGFSGEKLVEIATAHGIDASGKVGELRKRLVGNLPDWHPVSFEAPGPDIEDEGDEPEDPDAGEVDQDQAA